MKQYVHISFILIFVILFQGAGLRASSFLENSQPISQLPYTDNDLEYVASCPAHPYFTKPYLTQIAPMIATYAFYKLLTLLKEYATAHGYCTEPNSIFHPGSSPLMRLSIYLYYTVQSPVVKNWQHILAWEKKYHRTRARVSLSGFHSEYYQRAHFIKDTVLASDKHGVYGGIYQAEGCRKFSTFFPPSWDKTTLAEKVAEAFHNPLFFSKDGFVGLTQEGIKIQMYIQSRDNHTFQLMSFFPLYEGQTFKQINANQFSKSPQCPRKNRRRHKQRFFHLRRHKHAQQSSPFRL